MSKRMLSIVAAAAVCAALGAASWAQDATYVGSSKCKTCHNKGDLAPFKVWDAASHHKALDALSSDEAMKIAEEKGLEKPPAESPECLKCHVTGYDVATASVPEGLKMEDSVQCESCHGPASAHLEDGKTLMFKKDEAASIDLAAHINDDVKADTCVKCHNDESPTWDPERYTAATGEKVAFDFEQAWEKIKHETPK